MSQNNGIEKIVEDLQILEQQLQSILIEKQSMEAEINEIDNAVLELGKTQDEVYKVLGGIMMRADKNNLVKELDEKKKLISARVKSIERHEDAVSKRVDEMREQIRQSLSANKQNSK